jgi:hypothetical protein
MKKRLPRLCFDSSVLLLFCTSLLLPQAKIAVDLPVVDMGRIFQGETKTIIIPFRNAGNDTLLVKEVTTSCGCTVAKPSHSVIAPGDEATVEAAFNSTGFQGPLTKVVTIRTNDTSSPYTAIRIKFDVVAHLVPGDGAYNLWIGNVMVGKSLRKAFSFQNTSDNTISIVGGTSPSPEVTVHPVTTSLKPGESGTADVEVAPLKEGYVQAELQLQLGGTEQRVFVMRLTYFGIKTP